MYVVAWLFYYYLFVPDFLDKYIANVLRDVAASDLDAKTKEMENLKEMYKRDGKKIPTEGPGLQIFRNAVNYFK